MGNHALRCRRVWLVWGSANSGWVGCASSIPDAESTNITYELGGQTMCYGGAGRQTLQYFEEPHLLREPQQRRGLRLFKPDRSEGAVIYNADYHTYQYCNGTNWVKFGGGSSVNMPAPSDGYFVMSKSTWQGNFEGTSDYAGADAVCLTELTTNTGWRGYTDANARGILTSGHVHAWICNGDGTCNNLNANTRYFFADANASSHGGANFTTDSNGLGPNNATIADWSQPFYFGSGYTYWTGARANTCASSYTPGACPAPYYQWGNTTALYAADCNSGNGHDWTYSTCGPPCGYGEAPQARRAHRIRATLSHRCKANMAGSIPDDEDTTVVACTSYEHLICYVNP